MNSNLLIIIIIATRMLCLLSSIGPVVLNFDIGIPRGAVKNQEAWDVSPGVLI